ELKRVLAISKLEQYEELTMTTAERLISEGIEKGVQQGIERGIEKGIKQGVEKGKLEDAGKMLKRGLI
ncbi:hypothetical protein LEP1GSC066_3419, partial [Leptospira sp. serovar Kenya str. Sh9]